MFWGDPLRNKKTHWHQTAVRVESVVVVARRLYMRRLLTEVCDDLKQAVLDRSLGAILVNIIYVFMVDPWGPMIQHQDDIKKHMKIHSSCQRRHFGPSSRAIQTGLQLRQPGLTVAEEAALLLHKGQQGACYVSLFPGNFTLTHPLVTLITQS